MAYPTTKVEISLTAGDGPYTASPTWTDVTSYVRSISINRGRQSDFEHFSPGTATITLDNRDNRFTPFNLSGPYVSGGVSLLTPRRQIRITADTGSGYVAVFRGYVSGWPVRWTSAGQDTEVTLDCFDTIGLLGNTDVTPDWSYSTTTALTPTHYWRWNDPQGSTSITDIGSIPKNLTKFGSTGNAYAAAPHLGLALPYQAASTVGGHPYNSVNGGSGNNGGTSGNLTVTTWASFGASDGVALMTVQGNGCDFDFTSRTSGNLYITIRSGATFTRYQTDAIVGTFVPHHYAITITAGTLTFYLDGVQSTLTLVTSGASTPNTTDWFYAGSFSVWQETAVFDKVLTAAQILSIYRAGQGTIVETTGARATRILAATSLNATRYSVAGTYEGTVSGIGNGNSVMPELQKTADSEGGDLFCDKAGVLQFTGRSYAYWEGAGATAATFTDTGADLPYGTELEISYDGDNLVNDVTITTASGGSVRVTNSATTNGTASTTVDTYLSTLADATSLANLEATSGSKVIPTVSPFDVSNANTLANWGTILGLELLDKISITRTPSSGTTFTQTMLLNGISHQITPQRWQTTLTGSARYIGYFVLDVSKLDGTDVLA